MTRPALSPRSLSATSAPTQAVHAVRNGSRNGSLPPAAPALRADDSAAPRATPMCPLCPVCTAPLPSPRARYCSAACRQHAFRLRHPRTATADQAARTDLPTLRRALQRQRTLVASTVYECPRCETRFVGERRCLDCHVFCRALGLGGACPECDHPVLVEELVSALGKEVAAMPTRV